MAQQVLREQFNVEWVLWTYNGSPATDYPGTWDRTDRRPTHGNCPSCYKMGPFKCRCNTCDKPFSLIIGNMHQGNADFEKWYNPVFLNTVVANEEPVGPRIEGHVQVNKKELDVQALDDSMGPSERMTLLSLISTVNDTANGGE
jgi:hypothetical protein